MFVKLRSEQAQFLRRKVLRERIMAARSKQTGQKAVAAKKAGRTAKIAPARASTKAAASKKGASASPPAAKARAKAPSKATKKAAIAPEARSAEAIIAGLEADLAVARARIAELEKQQEEVTNRIDWVIDSLQTLLSDNE
ncbi:MAG: hypothetical protein KDJ36_13555 [Hyphomicrobiaceae bacterium]|nr:hypothetical protein [Hyphomicrobiaceae bacterium]